MVEEENFPRGGKFVRAPKRPADENLFSSHTEKKGKRAKKDKKSQKDDITDANFHSLLKVHGTLSYKEIQDGMLLLACVKQVHEFSIDVEMPGLTKGFVKITSISDPFTKYLNKLLEEGGGEPNILRELFKIGQFVLVKVLNAECINNIGKLECTLNPREINSEKSHVSFKKGMLVWGCINSILDHGYELNVGVKNCRVFLPNKNVDEGKTFAIGEPLWVAIHKCDITAVATTLRVSAKEQHLKSNKVDDIDSLYDLIPGMQVEFLTEKITATGIQGKFLNDYFGYIDETQLKYPLKKTENYKEGKLISAYVMYLESATKVTHLTMRNLEPQLELTQKIGDVVLAEVISKRHNGIYLKLQPNQKCFISNKRLVASLPHKPKEDISAMIRTKFSVGTKHTCRILDYWPFARTYVCTTEKAVVKEKIFNTANVHPGDLVEVTIETIKPEGLVVSCGRIKGFVSNMFLSNAEYTDNIKRKFKEGYKAKARVLETKEGKNISLTLKPGQVESDKCLTLLSNVKRGENYTGVVTYTGESGAIVNFYGGVQGWLGKKFLFAGNDGDMTNFFYRGQVVNVWALGTREDQVLLSMKPPSESFPSISLEVGSIVKGYIGKIREDGIDITTKNGTCLGTIPNNHLSGSLNLCSTFKDTFKMGDKVTDLMCVDNNNMNCILSRKEGLLYRNKSYKVTKFEDLKPGYQIRCFYISDAKDGIMVKPLLLDFNEEILIMKDKIVLAREELPEFHKYQTIVAKIEKVDLDTKTLQLTAKFDKVFSSKVEKATAFFRQHLAEVRYLKKFGLEHGWDLCQYLSGQRVKCKIDKVGKAGGCSVVLPNGVQGLVPPKLCPDGLQPGNYMEGVFLDADFKHGYAEICLKPELCEKINENQDGMISFQNLASCFAETILIKKDSVVCVLKQEDGNKQLVYCPIYLHENDWKGCRGYYESNKLKLKLCICGMLDHTLIGVSKRLFMMLDKHNQSIEKGKKMGKQIIMHPEKSEIEEKSMEVKKTIKNNVVEKTASKMDKLKPVDRQKEVQNHSNGDHEDIDEEVKNSSSTMVGNKKAKGKLKQKNKIERKQKGENKIDDIDIGGEDIIAGDANSTEDEDVHIDTDLKQPTESITALLPGIKSFFQKPLVEESSSSEDDDEQLETVKKKKKLTPAEKAELARQEEERISKIEKELADSNKPLESAEQFDRKLLGKPNSSELWTRYMSFHIASTEIDKARTVAKRALEAINMTLTEERLNIWLAMLNLENMFGTKESFEKTFEEAVQYNDALTIYLRSIEMLAESGKFIDMEEKISKARRKFKQDSKMWLDIAKIYYQINKFKDARNLKDAALKSIQDKRTQMFIIVRFAILEFKYGEEDHGAAIFETVLSSDPKRVDIWSAYVDQLAKGNKIEQARRVLDRAITQRLPLKNMKTIFLKYRRFEEEHGTSDLVATIKEKAVEYVNKALKK